MAEQFMLAVDGPARGVLMAAPDPATLVDKPGTYYPHQVTLFGHAVHVGSVHADPDDILAEDLWQALVSSLARYAAEDIWCPWGPACPAGDGQARHRVTRACTHPEEVHHADAHPV